MKENSRRAMDLAMDAGTLLLKSGAEIYRVEETISRIATTYGIDDVDLFVLSTGIMMTGRVEGNETYAKVRHIPLGGTELHKVDAVNTLSREIVVGHYTIEEAQERLAQIDKYPGKRAITRIFASGLGAASFCYIAGGNAGDSLAAFFAGFFMYFFMIWTEHRKKPMAKLTINMICAFLASAFGLLFFQMGLGSTFSMIGLGAVMPLIPGVSFTNSIRDFANGDYIAGAIRLIDALLVAMGIAIGVIAFYLFYREIGGAFL